MDRIWNTHLAHLSLPGLSAETVMNLSLYLLRGMSFQSLSLENPDHYKTMRHAWAGMMKGLMGQPRDV
jgi:hypothetical protein